MQLYKNGNYWVMMQDNGTKTRMTTENNFVPAFAENCDVKITNRCNQQCSFCYEGCVPEGNHADLNQPWINSLHAGTELALNGNDMNIPGLRTFLIKLKNKGVYANITVNQNQFMQNYDKIYYLSQVGLIHGIGISITTLSFTNSSELQDFIAKAKTLPNAVLHVINGIISVSDLAKLSNYGFKLLILGYKTRGRGINYKNTKANKIINAQNKLSEMLESIFDWFDVVSFDNLALEQLNVQRLISPEEWAKHYMGDDGKYTFYIDMVAKTFAKNSVSDKRYPIEGRTVDEMFKIIQEEIND